MDKNWISKQFTKSLNSYNKEAIAQKEIVKRTSDLLSTFLDKDFSKILELGSGTGLLTEKILNQLQFEYLYLNDLNETFYDCIKPILEPLNANKYEFLKGDIELIVFPKELDLIISTSTEQWVKDKEAFYNKVEQALSPLGNFVFSTFGVENLKEIREATGLGLKYYEQEETRLMLSKNFEILYSKDEQIVLFFSSAKDILRHLKKTGVNGLQKQHWTKKTVNQLIEKIKEATFVEEGKYKLTYHPSYYILQKK